MFSNLTSDLKCLMNEKGRFKITLKRYTHSFYPVDEYLLSRKQLTDLLTSFVCSHCKFWGSLV
jgi:hypothetical protein